MLETLFKISQKNGSAAVFVKYNGEDKYTVGVSDRVTNPVNKTGTADEIRKFCEEELPGYLDTIEKENIVRKENEEKARKEAMVKMAEDQLKKEMQRQNDPAKTIKQTIEETNQASLF